MIVTAPELFAGVALDLALGDPPWLPHPVRAIGWWTSKVETMLNVLTARRLAGALLWLLVVAPVAVLVWATMALATHWISTYWIYSFLAIRSLDQETSRAVHMLQNGNLIGARQAIGMVVGRDTAHLNDVGRSVRCLRRQFLPGRTEQLRCPHRYRSC